MRSFFDFIHKVSLVQSERRERERERERERGKERSCYVWEFWKQQTELANVFFYSRILLTDTEDRRILALSLFCELE
jgi:hypothetical protein